MVSREWQCFLSLILITSQHHIIIDNSPHQSEFSVSIQQKYHCVVLLKARVTHLSKCIFPTINQLLFPTTLWHRPLCACPLEVERGKKEILQKGQCQRLLITSVMFLWKPSTFQWFITLDGQSHLNVAYQINMPSEIVGKSELCYQKWCPFLLVSLRPVYHRLPARGQIAGAMWTGVPIGLPGREIIIEISE